MDIGSHSLSGIDVLVDELESKFSIEEPYASDEGEIFGANIESIEGQQNESEPLKKSLEKSATSSSYGNELNHKASLEEKDENEPEVVSLVEPNHSPQPRPLSAPLVSAMKGSREKQGVSPRKLTVKWAADVYDPIPNSLSHTIRGKQKKSRNSRDKENKNYKNGKKVRKGSSARGTGSSSKDKKHHHHHHHHHRLTMGYGTALDISAVDNLDHFGIVSPEYCGSSYMKKSLTEFHHSFAEAL